MQISKNIQDDSAQTIAMQTSFLDKTTEQVIAPTDVGRSCHWLYQELCSQRRSKD